MATNQLLEGKVGTLGFITTEGYESILEIARQSVPDGYGNSYFWVKPTAIVPADRVRDRRRPAGCRRQRDPAVRRAGGRRRSHGAFAGPGIATIGVCFLHSYANAAHELAMRDVLAREHPRGGGLDLLARCCREYREYERAMTTLVDAAVKPDMPRYVANIAGSAWSPRSDGQRVGAIPFYVMKSNGGVLSADEVVHQPITTVLSGPAAGALGAAVVAERGRASSRW